MKYIRTYKSFKESEPVNEELLGGVLNWFKNLWNKAIAELEKLGENPSQEEITSWIDGNLLNPADDSYLFKQQMEDFKKKPEANDQDCLTLVDSILNPETGALGKQGMKPMTDALNKNYPPKKGEKMHYSTAGILYVITTIRNKAIVQYKFAGGPADGKVDPKKIIVDLKDQTHLPEVKKLLVAAKEDNKKKKEIITNWLTKTLIPQLKKFTTEIKLEDIMKYFDEQKITYEGKEEGEEKGEGYKVGDMVIYKRDKFKDEDWDKLTDDDKKKPDEGKMKDLQAEQIGIKKISKIEGDKVSFEDADFTKEMGDILMKAEVEKEEAKDISKKIEDIQKSKPENAKKISKFVDFIEDEKNKDKIAEIEKILGEEEKK